MSDIVERLRTLHRMYSIGGTTLTEAADEIEALRAQNERLKSEAASMWRGAVSNTVAVVDRVRNQFVKGLRLKKNVRLAHFDAELDIALGEWFDVTRSARPVSYVESENVFRAPTQTKDTTDDA